MAKRRIRRAARRGWPVALAAAGAAAISSLGSAEPVVSGPASSTEAKRVVTRELRRVVPHELAVRCARGRPVRRERARWSCRWQGKRHAAAGIERCSGRTRARHVGGRWRLRTLRRNCRVELPAPRAGLRYFGFSDNSWLDPINQVTAAEEAALASAAGATSHRIFLDWRYAEPRQDVIDEANFAHYTGMYDELVARDIRPLITIGLAPRWAWAPGVSCQGDCRYPPARSKDHEWAEFVAEVTRRYPRAAGIEIWNEPNIDIFWRDPDPRRYYELLRIAYETIKAVDPAMTVVGGAVGNIRDPYGGHIPTDTFLDAAYRLGMAAKMDVLSVHSYPFAPSYGPGSLFDSAFADVESVLSRHGDSQRRIWVTEVGVSTSDPRPEYRFDEQQQAAILRGTYENLLSRDRVEAVYFHSLLNRPRYAEGHQEFGYGVLAVGRPPRPKPAFCDWVRLAGNSFQGC